MNDPIIKHHMHKHKWELRDDGKYECRCGLVARKETIMLNVPWNLFDVPLGDFWRNVVLKDNMRIAEARLPLPCVFRFIGNQIFIEDMTVKKDLLEVEIYGLDKDNFLKVRFKYFPEEGFSP